MKKLIIIIVLILLGTVALAGGNDYQKGSFVSNNFTFGQKQQISLNLNRDRFSEDQIHPGVVLIVSGVGFFTAGYLTGRTPNGLSGPGYWPWSKQYGRAAAMTTGVVLFTGGLTYTIVF